MCGTKLAMRAPLSRKHRETARRAFDVEAPNAPRSAERIARLSRRSALRLDAEEASQRESSRAAGEQAEQDRSPYEVLGPCLRVHEELDDHDHAEQRQRGQPGCEPEDEERRAADLEPRGKDGGDVGR